jgi:CDP-diacylglycerol---glycerol-3-phosphate 3-phosphatidyltransferase
MASIYDLKPKFQNLLRPLSNWLARHCVTANEITIAAVFISLLAGIAVTVYPSARWSLWSVPFVLLLRMILNAIDGIIAREHHMQTALGTFLNELGDVLSDMFIFLPFSFIPGISIFLVVSIVILATISEMTGVVAVEIGASRRYDGPMGKSDRAFVFGTIGLLLGLGFEASTWLTVILTITAVLLMMTIMNRLMNALREIRTDP